MCRVVEQNNNREHWKKEKKGGKSLSTGVTLLDSPKKTESIGVDVFTCFRTYFIFRNGIICWLEAGRNTLESRVQNTS